jgi:predicted kinase
MIGVAVPISLPMTHGGHVVRDYATDRRDGRNQMVHLARRRLELGTEDQQACGAHPSNRY